MALLPNPARRICAINIELCLPGLPSADRDRLVRRSLIETGKAFTETGALWHWDRNRIAGLVQGSSGRPALDAALANGRPVVILSPHLGNWEMAGLYCSMEYTITSLYRPPRIKELGAFMHQARERLGARLVPTNAQGVRSLYRALERGELVGILPDQEPRQGGVFVPFFGIPAYTMSLVARLVKKTGAAVFFIYAERLARGAGFHLHIVPAPAGLEDESIEAITATINLGVESCVRKIPEQYQWSYKRFNSRPEGAPQVY